MGYQLFSASDSHKMDDMEDKLISKNFQYHDPKNMKIVFIGQNISPKIDKISSKTEANSEIN